MNINTDRLLLIPSTLELAEAEIINHELFSILLDAKIPNNWPTESLVDALPYYCNLLKKHPDWVGWLDWYAIKKAPIVEEKGVLVGGVGFYGPPDQDGLVEIGYSVLTQYRRKGYATEMLKGLISFAKLGGVKKIIAHTEKDNSLSQNVLINSSFVFTGVEDDSDKLLYSLHLDKL
jgi:[ribosomal protein S5]-alanine N-acetyltransferase